MGDFVIVKPFKGQYATRQQANRINDMFDVAEKPDHTALKKEAKEFEKMMLKRRQKRLSCERV